ncbi:FAD-binding oxidoreductase [Nesterenkonia sp. F]|uniref:FAD-binding oxidoreductase n=1 Tax=Nesterenkonia sp. F TaxID=795955 RepID=UPI000255D1C3|nr:FAD-linked oxidase C-terminal domain-containing protein [Nesterenkonia sp. F]
MSPSTDAGADVSTGAPASGPSETDGRVVEALRRALPGRVVTDPEVLTACTADRSGHRADAPPLAVVEAREVADVQETCRIASAHGTPIVTRAAGTGLAGGAVAGGGEIVLSTRSMDRILEISPADRLAVVGPGILNGDLNRALAEHGLWWAPDPASRDISTVGGNIAMNAGGLLCAKYGVTREAVLALTVVLADGRVVETGHRTVKGVSGYDLCALLIGSEGTLGIIVEATLRLDPLPEGPPTTIGAFFDSVDDAARAAAAITAAGHRIALMELMDEPTLAAVAEHADQDLLRRGRAHLLVQCDGPGAATLAEAVVAVLRDHGGDVEATDDEQRAAELLALRRAALPALEAQGTLLVEDIAVPRSRLAETFAAIRELEAAHGVTIPTTCHAGDGNLHPTFVVTSEEIPARVWAAAEALFAHALAVGGTLTGEHGIGLLKRAWLPDELGPEQLQLQRGIKAVFDPQGLLNPGKIFAQETA